MFRTNGISRKKPSLVNFFCGTNLVRSAKSDGSSKTLSSSEENEKNSDSEGNDFVENKNKSHSNKKLYTNVYSDEEKQKAKEKLKDLISDIKVWNVETTFVRKTVDVAKAKKIKKSGKRSKFDFEKTLIKSAEEVAETFGKDATTIKSDLINSLSSFAVSFSKEDNFIAQKPTMKGIPGEMQRSKIKKGKTIFRLDDQEQTKPLAIFKKWDQCKESPTKAKLMIWDQLDEENLKYLALTPPKNYFEELIMWTEQGKLWHFPINNHQGMEEEAETNFTEHIFLEDYLEPWCPKMGPLRHFMELVLVGLSKNSVLTVQDKKEHIYWFRDYFESKKKLLKELGAFTSTTEQKKEF